MKGVADLLILVLNLELKQLVTFLPHTSLETPEFVHKQIFAVAQSLKAECVALSSLFHTRIANLRIKLIPTFCFSMMH